MKYLVSILLAVAAMSANASEVSDQIKRACALKENQSHPVCMKREERKQKMRASREAKEQAQLDSILGKLPTH